VRHSRKLTATAGTTHWFDSSLVPRAQGLVALLGRMRAREPLSPGVLAVLRGIVTLADGLGLPSCAPGVAGGAQGAALRRVGCALLQGPWYPPPMPACEASAWLAAQAIRPAPMG
jgi:EAL domain-containing protein (putative c-di-GMP-specific phosphodiesterase class I)